MLLLVLAFLTVVTVILITLPKNNINLSIKLNTFLLKVFRIFGIISVFLGDILFISSFFSKSSGLDKLISVGSQIGGAALVMSGFIMIVSSQLIFEVLRQIEVNRKDIVEIKKSVNIKEVEYNFIPPKEIFDVFCPVCNKIESNQYAKCSNCGASFIGTNLNRVNCSKCNSPRKNSTIKFCAQCGNQFND